MRIGMVTHAYPRYDGDMAGVFIEFLAQALVAKGHTLHVITPSDRGEGGSCDQHGVAVHRIRYAPAGLERLAHRGTMLEGARSPLGALALLNMLRTLRRAVQAISERESLEVMHAHWWAPSGVAASRACRRTGVPYVVTSHGTDVWLLGRIPGVSRLAQRVYRKADVRTAVSSFLAKRIKDEVGEMPIVIQPMPTDSTGFTSVSHGGAGVITVGRLSPQKRVADLLAAISILNGRGTSVPVTIIGDGVERTNLEQQARADGIHAEFIGRVRPADLPGRLKDMDVAVMPADREGFGLAAVEALMAGIPVVATTRGGGLLEVVGEGDHGRVVDSDPSAIADAIEYFMDNTDARSAAAAAGARWREALDPTTVAESFERIYASIVER